MTCVVALVKDGQIWMGSDSAASSSGYLDLIGAGTNKMFAKKVGRETCLIGGSGSGRFTQLLEHALDLPALPDQNMPESNMKWIVVEFINAIRAVLKDGGYMTIKETVETTDGTLLVGLRGRLYEIQSHLYVKTLVDLYGAIGSGSAEACGVMYGINKLKVECDPETTILAALEAAERWTPSVRRPFTVIHS